mmetsp:Transcript_14290/g.29807  ORF Transcript_14290/g.29807 Transcript_14290/m.29807 type:complete len:174 (-) Transcript_14290:688-1209(-)
MRNRKTASSLLTVSPLLFSFFYRKTKTPQKNPHLVKKRIAFFFTLKLMSTFTSIGSTESAKMSYYEAYKSEEEDRKPAGVDKFVEEEDLSSSSGDSGWDSSSDEELDWDSLNPAKFQVGRQWVNQAERIQQPRQDKRYQKVEFPTEKKSVPSRNKRNAAWVGHSQKQIPIRTT